MQSSDVRAQPLLAGPSHRLNIFESSVFRLLQTMTRGRLKLVMPNGSSHEFGSEPTGLNAQIRVRDTNFFRRCVLFGDVGFGEAYEAGEWDSDDLTAVVSWMILNIENNPVLSGSSSRQWSLGLLRLVNRLAHAFRGNTLRGSKANIAAHYDLGNEFFRLFLDPSMTYSAADFGTGLTGLESAQRQKYNRLAESLRLRATDHVLEIGTGWGGFAVFAAQQFGSRVTTITISNEQATLARERVRELGLEEQVEVKLCDYREISGTYDKIVSIEMLEAVGAEHLSTYFSVCHRALKPKGLLGLQVITCPDARFEKLRKGVDWSQKHIFPGSILPSVAAINKAVNATGDLNLYDLHDMGRSYARTLAEWRGRFNENHLGVRALSFGEAFIRKWNYYFSYCEAAFLMKNVTVVQMLYGRPNHPEL